VADESGESDLRRRAAVLLVTLAVAAVLVVFVMVKLLDNSGNANGSTGAAAPDDTLSAAPTTSAHSARPSTRSGSPSTTAGTGATSTGPATASCPTDAPCVLQGDAAKAIQAVNAYRTQNGRKAVPGTVSAGAQKCALSDGSRCSGGWAETYLDKLDGTAAVNKIAKLGKLLDPQLKSFEVGWAYRPEAKTYYLAVIRTD
jgi:hypothetical protein